MFFDLPDDLRGMIWEKTHIMWEDEKREQEFMEDTNRTLTMLFSRLVFHTICRDGIVDETLREDFCKAANIYVPYGDEEFGMGTCTRCNMRKVIEWGCCEVQYCEQCYDDDYCQTC